MKKKEWKRKYKELHERYLLLQQSSLRFCSGCAWNAILPNGVCLNCQYWDKQMEEKKDKESS